MKLLQIYFNLEKKFIQDQKKKLQLLNLINQLLMTSVLGILLLGLNQAKIFDHILDYHGLMKLLLIYLFFNFLSILIRKQLILLSSMGLIFFLLAIFSKLSFSFGIDFYLNSPICSLAILLAIVLFNPKFAFLIYLLISLNFLLCFILQIKTCPNCQRNWQILNFDFLFVFLIMIYCLLLTLIGNFLVKHYEAKLKFMQKKYLNKLINLVALINLGKVTSSLIQEIRNQLSIISLVLQNAEINHQSIEYLEYAKTAVEQIDRFSRLEYFDFFKEIELEVFSLNVELNNLLILFKRKLKQENVKIFLQNNQNFQLYADRVKLDLVIANLILNAIEAYQNIDREEKHIFIKLIKKPRNLLIKVKDYGQGIEPKNLVKIFEPYFTSKNSNQALGLGLYISQLVMQRAFSSKIKVESILNQGSTFTLYIKNKFLLI